jgi:predicted DNA-binding transcriptional regulator AlpA
MTGRPERALPLPEKRGLSRVEAAQYIGVSSTLFDVMVNDGRMPPPREINARIVWDRRELDVAFDNLPHRGAVTAPAIFRTRQDAWGDLGV